MAPGAVVELYTMMPYYLLLFAAFVKPHATIMLLGLPKDVLDDCIMPTGPENEASNNYLNGKLCLFGMKPSLDVPSQ